MQTRSKSHVTTKSPSYAPSAAVRLDEHDRLLDKRAPKAPSAAASVRIKDYLCSCEDCPRAKAIEREFRPGQWCRSEKQHKALLRVLRACATYDETKPLATPLFWLADRLLFENGFDQERTFQELVASALAA